MAFNNSQIDPITGIECTFWTLIQVNVNRLDQSCHVVVGGWPSQDLYDSGKTPLMQQSYDLSGEHFPLPESSPVASQLRSQFEAMIQELPPFKAEKAPDAE